MRLVGDIMLVGIKDAAKLIGISIITCCAVLICVLFINFYFDVIVIKDEITSELALMFFDLQEFF